MEPKLFSTKDLHTGRMVYFFFFSGFGILMTFLNVYYRSRGLSGLQIGTLTAVFPLVGMIFAPLWGYVNDRLGNPKVILALATMGTLGSLVGMNAASSFTQLLAAVGVLGAFYSMLMPVVDVVNLKLLEGQRERYGEQRIWGSLGFIFTTLSTGWLFERFGLHMMFAACGAAFLGMLVGVLRLPAGLRTERRGSSSGLRLLVTNPAWVIFTIGQFILSISSTGMNHFLGVYMRELGAGESLVGMAVGIGAVSELPVMRYSQFFLKRLGAPRMLLLACGAYALRFALYSWMPSAEWALLVGLLNGLTFGMFWVSAVVYINTIAPPEYQTTAQSLVTSVVSLATVSGAPLSGWVFDHWGGSTLYGLYIVLALAAGGVLAWGVRRTGLGKTHSERTV